MERVSEFYTKFKIFWLKEKKYILISLVCGFIITLLCAINSTRLYANEIQEDIANRIVRFHVIANSDTYQDQQLKLQVRDDVLNQMKDILSNCKNVEEGKKILCENMDTIKNIAQNTVYNNGFDYDVNVFMSNDIFPTKTYGEATFPCGLYNALRIEIGEAKGYNWWCVMYPPLCFAEADSTQLTAQSRQDLKNILTEEEYEIILSSMNKNKYPKIKLKIIELWQKNKFDESDYVTKA